MRIVPPTSTWSSPNTISDPAQNMAQWFDYAPYGSVIASTNTGTTTDARQSIGQYADNTGLSYLNARYYNGAQGQFTTEDPVFWGQRFIQSDWKFESSGGFTNSRIYKNSI
jgi:RHS repeat-associated protein